MEEEIKVGCARPTGGPVGEPAEKNPEQEKKTTGGALHGLMDYMEA